jgi:hypothetical protein
VPLEPPATTDFVAAQVQLHRDRGDDTHLRSCRAIEQHHTHATDGDIGPLPRRQHSDWWLGHQTLVAPLWITAISWIDATSSVDLTRQTVKDVPIFDGMAPPAREQGRGLSDHPRSPEPS